MPRSSSVSRLPRHSAIVNCHDSARHASLSKDRANRAGSQIPSSGRTNDLASARLSFSLSPQGNPSRRARKYEYRSDTTEAPWEAPQVAPFAYRDTRYTGSVTSPLESAYPPASPLYVCTWIRRANTGRNVVRNYMPGAYTQLTGEGRGRGGGEALINARISYADSPPF